MMTVVVNHQQRAFAQNGSLESLIADLKMTTQGIAIAVNNQIIPKEQWSTKRLNNNDQITILQATQGG